MKSKNKWLWSIIAAIGTGILFFPKVILATVSPVENQVIDILLHNAEYFQQNDLFADMFRSIGWWLVSLLRTLCIAAEQLYLYCFKLLTFSTDTKIQNLISSMQPMYHAILLLSITVIGLMLMMFNSKFPNFLRSILLTVAVVTCSFYVISQLNKALYDTETDTGLVTWAIGENNTVVNEVLNANIVDLLYVDQKEENGLLGFNKDNVETYHYPNLTDEMFNIIHVREVLNYKDDQLSEAGKELLKKKIKVGVNGLKTSDVGNGFGWNSEGDSDIGNEFYYRYYINYSICILTLFAFVAVYVSMSFVVVKIIVNLVLGQILSILYSADLTGSKKTWMILNTMKDGYIALFLTALSVRIYTLFQAWLNDVFADHRTINAIILVLLDLAIISGPSIIEKVTGQNVGVSGGLGMMYAAKQAMHGVASVPGHLASAGKTLANGFGWAVDHTIKSMPGTPSSSSNGQSGTPRLPGGGEGTSGNPATSNNGPTSGGTSGALNKDGDNPNNSGLQKENGLDDVMRKMSNETSKKGQYDSKIQDMNAMPSELQNSPIDNIMNKMPGNKEGAGEQSSLNDSSSGVDEVMNKMPGNKEGTGEQSSLNDSSSGVDEVMNKMSGNKEGTGEQSSLKGSSSSTDSKIGENLQNQKYNIKLSNKNIDDSMDNSFSFGKKGQRTVESKEKIDAQLNNMPLHKQLEDENGR